VLSKVQELDPDEPDVHILLSSVYTCQGNAPEALRSAEEALRLSPGNPVAICNTAACLLKGGFAADAEAALRRGAASSARHPRSALLLGDCLGAQGRLDEALSEYERALDFDPQDQLARDRRDRAGEHRRCIASLMNEVDLGNSGAHLGLALELEAVHRWTDAIMECRAALETEPEGREAARCLARCMGASGRVTEARKLFAELRLSWPNDPEPWIEEARVLRTAGRNLDAVHCLRDALTVYPYCARAFWEMVGLLFVEGRWDDAGDALRAPFASEPQARDELLAFQARLNDDELGLDYEDFLRAKELLTAVMYPGSAAATSDNPAR